MVFGKFFTDHMFKVFFHEDLGGWQTPEITPLENLVLHPACKALHYAVQVQFLIFYREKIKLMIESSIIP